ncbi:MAG: hypothetical protein IJ400_05365 [Clostridia bacterium]|nr:hypothetical protein [Clostridia bacterium]
MKYRVIGWTNYENEAIPEGEYSLAKEYAIVEDIRKHNYVFTGMHHENHPYCAPVLNTGERILLSQRGFGDTMSLARRDGTYVDYAYDWEMDPEDKGFVFPEGDRCIDVVDKKENVCDLWEKYEIKVTREQFEEAEKTGKIVIFPNPVYDFLDIGDHLTLLCDEDRQECLVVKHYVDFEEVNEEYKVVYKLRLEIIE